MSHSYNSFKSLPRLVAQLICEMLCDHGVILLYCLVSLSNHVTTCKNKGVFTYSKHPVTVPKIKPKCNFLQACFLRIQVTQTLKIYEKSQWDKNPHLQI